MSSYMKLFRNYKHKAKPLRGQNGGKNVYILAAKCNVGASLIHQLRGFFFNEILYSFNMCLMIVDRRKRGLKYRVAEVIRTSNCNLNAFLRGEMNLIENKTNK